MSEENQEQEQIQAKENSVESNLAKQRKMYERKLQEEAEARQQAEERIRQLEMMTQKRQQSEEDEEDEEDEFEPYVDKKKLKKTLNKFEEITQKKAREIAKETINEVLETERKQNFLKQNSDFNQVMTEEIIEKFATEHPDMADAISTIPNQFERQKLVYQNIKALKLDKPKQTPSVQDKINQNKQHPGYQPSGFAGSAYSNQGDFSPSGQKMAYDKMKDLQRRMRIN